VYACLQCQVSYSLYRLDVVLVSAQSRTFWTDFSYIGTCRPTTAMKSAIDQSTVRQSSLSMSSTNVVGPPVLVTIFWTSSREMATVQPTINDQITRVQLRLLKQVCTLERGRILIFAIFPGQTIPPVLPPWGKTDTQGCSGKFWFGGTVSET